MPVPAGGDPTSEPDLLATVEDLQSMPGTDGITDGVALILLQCATAVVQAAAGGQRIVEATSTAYLDGNHGKWLWLPQRPVQSVESVTVDGEALTPDGWKLRGQRLRRTYGTWMGYSIDTDIEVVYTHGWPEGSQELQLARGTVLSLATGVFTNPGGVSREQLDDYSVAYEATASRLEANSALSAALLRTYGYPAGLISVGG